MKVAILSYVSSDFNLISCYAVAADKLEDVRCDWALASPTRIEREKGYFNDGILVMERWLVKSLGEWRLNRAEAFDDRRSFEAWLRRNGLRGQPCVENALDALPDPE
jgi:hypothetical protein